MYLQEISAVSLLTAEEGIALDKGVEAGDTDAATRMAEANLRLVVSVAKAATCDRASRVKGAPPDHMRFRWGPPEPAHCASSASRPLKLGWSYASGSTRWRPLSSTTVTPPPFATGCST